VVVKTRQHLGAVLVQDRVLVLDLLGYASELRDPAHLCVPGTNLKALRIARHELQMAERLIAEMTEPWKPGRYHDEYRDELLAFIRKRGRAGKLATAPEEAEEEPAKPKRAQVIDIAELLRKSLAKAGPVAREDRRRPRRKKTA
jgi:DNA end-binding protein Ku